MNSEAAGRIGRYRLEAVLGTGAFSSVYRAYDERLGDVVALKVLADNRSLDPDVRERFLAEGRVLRRIDSAHVVRVHDLGETDRAQPYLVLEHADRGTLADRVDQLRAGGWRPSPDDVRAVVEPLVSALEAVHGADVVHRDLSPRNVLLRSTLARGEGPSATVVADDERLLVADLGLCKDLAVHSGMTVAGGTEGFRAPEQREGPATITSTADLWSLSALTLWLLTGSTPSGEDSCRDAVVAAGVPARFAEVLDRGLATDPQDRPADVSAWWAEIEEVLAPHRSGGDADTRRFDDAADAPDGPDGAATSGRSSWRTRLGVPVLAAVLGLAVGVGIMTFGGGPQTTTENGQVRVEAGSGDLIVAIEGPDDVTVGETATFLADGEGVARWLWVDPSGGLHQATALDVTPSSTGGATIRLLGVSDSGEVIEVAHRLTIDDADL